MEVKQLYTSCISEAAYFIESNGEVAIIDPLRDVDAYLQLADEKKAKIKYIFETHFHADFVSGHLELAQKTGAPIIFGPDAKATFPVVIAKDGQVFKLGNTEIKVIHTPGHTVESTCYLLHQESGEPYCIFTGDTLFVGDVGRPDLSSGNLSKEELAGILYDSLQQKIKPLDDNIIVYPAHGPGSACGKNLGPDTFSTMGVQKKTNYALQNLTKEEFIEATTNGLCAPPAYFPLNAKINQSGYDSMEELMQRAMKPLSVTEFKDRVENGALILDTRLATKFTEGFVPESLSIGLEGRFAEWAGTLIPLKQDIVLVTELGKEKESVTRLARVGIDNIVGYLAGGYESWLTANEKFDLVIDIEADELLMDLPVDDKLEIIDVRKPSEFEAGHVKGASNFPLDTLSDPLNIAMIEDDKNLYIHCLGGYRSVIAASILKKHGFHNIRNIVGGYNAIKAVPKMPIVEPKKIA